MPKRPDALLSRFFTPDGQRLNLTAYLFLILLCMAFFLPGLASLPPTDRDESSFAQASKQMIETGNLVDIRLQDEPRYKKPVGIYWLQAATVKFLNSDHLNEIWAYRVPSVIGATVAVLMTAALGALLFSPLAGLLAAIMMAGSFLLNTEARLAKTDAALLGSIMVAQYALARVYPHKNNIPWHIPFAFWTALGVGILLKGPIILMVVLSTLLWLRLADKNLTWASALKPWIGIPYILLLTVPWFIAVTLQSNGTFLAESAGHDLFAKLWQGQNHASLPPGIYLLFFSLAFFPFSLFTLLAVPDTWLNRHQPAVRFCLGWIIPAWILFECSLTKLPHYVLPLYPAIALLTAKALCDGFPTLAERKRPWITVITVGVWLTLGTGFALAGVLTPFLVDHVWNAAQIFAGAVLILTQGTCLFLLFNNKQGSLLIMAAGSFVFTSCVFGNMLPNLHYPWMSNRIISLAETIKPCQKLQLVTASYNEPSLIFLAGTETKRANDGGIAAARMLNNSCLVGVIDDDHINSFYDAFIYEASIPLARGRIEGFNTGQGKKTTQTLFTLPMRNENDALWKTSRASLLPLSSFRSCPDSLRGSPFIRRDARYRCSSFGIY